MKHSIDCAGHRASPGYRWHTLPASEGLVEVQECQSCGEEVDREYWPPPLSPPWGGSCMNCGGGHRQGTCTRCGLDVDQDLALHQELLKLLPGSDNMLAGAQAAGAQGRMILALKLATAAVHLGPRPPAAWVLRIRLLRSLGLQEEAVQDARQLCRAQPAWGEAFSELGLSLSGAGQPGARAAADMALSLDPQLASVRSLRAELLYESGRFAAARQDCMQVLRGPESSVRALALMRRYARHLMGLGEVASLRELLDSLGKHVLADADLLALLAWQRWQDGLMTEAHAAIDAAEALRPDLELTQMLRQGPLPQEQGFWSWLST